MIRLPRTCCSATGAITINELSGCSVAEKQSTKARKKLRPITSTNTCLNQKVKLTTGSSGLCRCESSASTDRIGYASHRVLTRVPEARLLRKLTSLGILKAIVDLTLQDWRQFSKPCLLVFTEIADGEHFLNAILAEDYLRGKV